MKAHFKRALSLLLCTAMVFGCFGGVTGIVPTSRAATTNLLADLDPTFESSSYNYLLQKYGFDSDWKKTEGGTAAYLDSDYSAVSSSSLSLSEEEYGKYLLQMKDGSATGGAGLVSPQYTVTAGTYYRVGADILSTTDCNIYIYFYDGDGNKISNSLVPQYHRLISSTNGVPKEVGALCRAPEGAVTMAVNFAMTAAGVGNIYLDNLFLGAYDPATEDEIPVPISAKSPAWGANNFLDDAEETHPRLYFTAAELSTLKTVVTDDEFMASAYADLIALADVYAAETSFYVQWYAQHCGLVYDVNTFPDPNEPITFTRNGTTYTFDVTKKINGETGYHNYFIRLGQTFQEKMQCLALAYALSGEVKYAERAIYYAMGLAENWSSWTQVNHTANTKNASDMGCAYFTTGVATVYDMCYARMTDAQRTTISQAIISKGLNKLCDDLCMPEAHNERLTKASGLMVGASAIINATNREAVEPFMTWGYNYVQWYLDELRTSGEQEGYYYTDHSLEGAMEGVSTVSRVGNIAGVINHAYFTDILVDWVVYGLIPGSGTVPEISDTQTIDRVSFEKIPLFFKTMNLLNAAGNEKAGFYLNELKDKGVTNQASAFEKLLYSSINGSAATAEDIQQTATIVDEIGYGYLRSGFGALDMALTMISNDSQAKHNHLDQNSFVLGFNGKAMASDFGYGIVDAVNNDYGFKMGHTTIFVDDAPQSVQGTGELSLVMGSNLYGHLLGSAAGAYGGTLTQADRHAIMLNHKDRPYYVIIDELASAGAHTYGWNLYTQNWYSANLGGQTTVSGSGDIVPNTTVAGNRITVQKGTNDDETKYDSSINPDTLFVHFVGKDSLNLSTIQGTNTNGTTTCDARFRTIRANTATTKTTHQFMTVLSAKEGVNAAEDISISFASADTASSTATSGQNENFAWSTSSTEAKDMVKQVNLGNKYYLFFRGAQAGDYYEMYFDVETSGEYNVRLNLLQSPGYGQYEVFLDDVSYGIYDGQSTTAAVNHYSLGVQNVTAGAHTIKLVLVGKSEESSNYWMSCGGIDLLGVSDINVDKVYDDDSLLGAVISYKENLQDIIVHNRISNTITADDLTTNGKQVSLLGVSAGKVTEGFAAISASALTYGDQVLLSAANPLSVAADYTGETVYYQVNSTNEQKISLYVDGAVQQVMIGGQPAAFEPSVNMFTLTVPAGESVVVVSLECAHSDIEWTVVEEPSCEEPGQKTGTCPDCGAAFQETIDALGHDSLYFPATEPDGMKPGNPEYWYCARCNTYYADEQCTQIIEDIDSLGTKLDFDKENIRMGESLSLVFAIAKSKVNGTDTSKYVAKWSVEHTNTTNSGEIPFANWITYTIDGTEYWGIEVSDLAAKEMGDNVSIWILYDDVQVTNVKTMAIRDYVLERLENSTDSLFKAVCVDMLHYGAAAQEYFGYKTNDLVNAGQPDSATVLNIDKSRRITKDDDGNFIGSAVRFVSNLTMSFAVKDTSGIESGKVTFINHKGRSVTVEVDSYASIIIDGTMARQFEFGEIVVADIDALIKVELYDAQGNVMVALTDSLDAYVGRTKPTSRMYDLAQDFAKFSTSAYAYFHRNDDLGEYC